MTNSDLKGKAGERELARKLRELGYPGARRSQQHKGAADAPDLIDAIPGVAIECKRVEKLSIYPALEKAKKDAGPGDVPVVMHRRNHKQWLVTVELDRLLDLAERINRR